MRKTQDNEPYGDWMIVTRKGRKPQNRKEDGSGKQINQGSQFEALKEGKVDTIVLGNNLSSDKVPKARKMRTNPCTLNILDHPWTQPNILWLELLKGILGPLGLQASLQIRIY